MPNETVGDGGWEVIKRRRPRGKGKAPQVPKVPEKKGGDGKKDGRSREEVLRAFERDCERWGREWEGLGCREGLEGVMGRIRGGLGIRSLSTGEGEAECEDGVKEEGKGASRESDEGGADLPGTTKDQPDEKLNSSQRSPGPGDGEAKGEGKEEAKVPSCESEGNAEAANPPETTKDHPGEQPKERNKAGQPNGTLQEGTKPRWPRRRSGLSRAVCLGIGSFEDEGWEVVRRTWVQYFAFLTVVRGLGSYPLPPILYTTFDTVHLPF